MSRIIINNHAEPEWTAIIESRLQIMLGSMLADLHSVEVEFSRLRTRPNSELVYSCKLMLTDRVGDPFLLYNDQPDGKLAIEGAIARARRALNRAQRARRPSWQRVSEQ